VNRLIRDAAPDIVQKVIDQALSGDVPAANLLIARAAPPLKAQSPPVAIDGDPKNYWELATAIMEAMLRGADPQSAQSALQALHTAAKVHELYGFEQRITALEHSSEGS
jgi:hypothetical protein